MDALALLCNLHGAGPLTLEALRSGGCNDLIDLESFGEQQLAKLLERDLSGARRFLREARVLRERVGDEVEIGEQKRSAIIAPLPPRALEPILDREVTGLIAPLASPEQEPNHTGPVVSAVLELWNRIDETAEVASPTNLLSENPLSGLKPDEMLALDRAGIRTIEDLANADLLDLIRVTGLSYTHLAHLAFLARKLFAQLGERVSSPAAHFGESNSKAQEPDLSEGSAGPFA